MRLYVPLSCVWQLDNGTIDAAQMAQSFRGTVGVEDPAAIDLRESSGRKTREKLCLQGTVTELDDVIVSFDETAAAVAVASDDAVLQRVDC